MTTANATTPTFRTSYGHPAVRATIIIGLCASLFAGFLATASHVPAPTSNAAQQASPIACDHARAERHAC